MKITVVGTGYVGLVSGTCFAETGNHVTCVDIDEQKVASLKNGEIPIYEPKLDVLFERSVRQGRLHFTTSLEEGIKDAEVIFLALPTPPDADGFADLKFVLKVAEDLGKIMTDYKVIVDKSTVPVGTAEKVHAAIAKNAQVDFDVVSNPEFLREGFAVDDFLKPERVVVGASSEKAFDVMRKLYAPFIRQGNPLIEMDEKSAELTKYAANSFLATKISFMNEVANMCELVGADVDHVRHGIGTDTRIGKRFLFPGIGYGGSCFPKDVSAMYKSAEDAGYHFQILESVMEVNAKQKKILVQKIKQHIPNLKGKKVAIWGLAFKPDTDDIREAPALEIINELLLADAQVQAFDPEAMPNVQKIYGEKVSFCENMYEAAKEVDFLVICTEWSVFRNPDFEQLNSLLKEKVIFDGRNLFDPQEMKQMGYTYLSIGRGIQ